MDKERIAKLRNQLSNDLAGFPATTQNDSAEPESWADVVPFWYCFLKVVTERKI